MDTRSAELLNPSGRRVLVSFSPLAGKRSSAGRAQELAAELESAGYSVRATSDLGELKELALQGHSEGDLRCVIACGGDGTAAVVRNCTPLDVPLLLVPLGTENLLARYLEQSSLAAAVCETVDQGTIIALDLGCLHAQDLGSRYFLTMFSAGFDAEVVRRLQALRRGNISRISYIQPTLSAIRSYDYPELQLYCSSDPVQSEVPLRCRWAFGFNLPLYACGWRVAPDADGTDGLLDVCTFHNGSLRHVAWYLWHVVRQSHFQLSDARLIRGRTLRVESAGATNVPFQMDGDFGGMLPVDIDILPGRLRMLVMPNVAARLGFS